MKRTLIAVWVIVFLVLTNLVTLYFLTRKNAETGTKEFAIAKFDSLAKHLPKFIRPIPESAATAYVNAYRGEDYVTSDGVLYDTAEIKNYITNIMPTIMNRMAGSTNITQYKWELGFYWMERPRSDGSIALDFCVVPTLVNKSDTIKVVDYFNDGGLYNHSKTNSVTSGSSCDTCNAYDEGQLWP
jgi:hypothetical protein